MDKKPNTTNDTHSTPPSSSKSAQPSHSKTAPPTTVSWITERNILREFGDRRTRAILAILTARRSSGSLEFFVPPHIAGLFNLTPKDLSWALQDLEGKLVNTRSSIKGKFRKVCLLPAWENQVGSEGQRRNVVAESENAATYEELLIGKPADRRRSPRTLPPSDPEVDAMLRALVQQPSSGTQPSVMGDSPAEPNTSFRQTISSHKNT